MNNSADGVSGENWTSTRIRVWYHYKPFCKAPTVSTRNILILFFCLWNIGNKVGFFCCFGYRTFCSVKHLYSRNTSASLVDTRCEIQILLLRVNLLCKERNRILISTWTFLSFRCQNPTCVIWTKLSTLYFHELLICLVSYSTLTRIINTLQVSSNNQLH